MTNPGTDPTSERVAASVRNHPDGSPIPRDVLAAHLQTRADREGGLGPAAVVLSSHQAEVVAELLDELAAVYRDEPLGRLARELAVRIYDRLGI